MRRILMAMVLIMLPMIAKASSVPCITVRPNVETAGDVVLLGDIASIKTGDKTIADKLKKTEVCTSPLPGKTRKLSRSQVIISLRRVGMDNKSLSIVCPDYISITRSSMNISGQQLFETAKDYIMSTNALSGTIYVEAARSLPDIHLPVGQMELKTDASNAIRKGQNSIAVDVLLDGKPQQRVYVPVMVKIIAKVLVASKPISKDEELTTDNTALQDRDITNLPYEACTDEPSDGVQASMPIGEGNIIRRQWVKPPLMVHSGDNVIVVAQAGSVRVTDKGTAAQDGSTGDTVKVRFDDGNREVRAVVIEPGVVQIRSFGRN